MATVIVLRHRVIYSVSEFTKSWVSPSLSGREDLIALIIGSKILPPYTFCLDSDKNVLMLGELHEV